MADFEVIASIFPMPRNFYASLYLKRQHFNMPAAGMDRKPVLLVIEDDATSEYIGGGIWRPQVKPAVEIAVPLVDNVWTQLPGRKDGHGPGIWVVPKNASGSMPTVEEVMASPEYKYHLENQSAYFTDLAIEAEDLDANGKKGEILPLHRVAGRWLGRSGKVWQEGTAERDSKPCPYCGKYIPMAAIKCPEAGCGEVVDVEKYAALQAKKAQAMKAAGAPLAPPLQPQEPKQQARA